MVIWNVILKGSEQSKCDCLKFTRTTKMMGALPSRFRRERVLLVGCGDVGQRVARLWADASGKPRVRLLALTSTPSRASELRALGITPLKGNLDQAASLGRLAGLAHRVVHLAPPPNEGLADWRLDPRTRALMRALARRTAPLHLVYGSTTGVYGDRQGQWVTEVSGVQPQTPRAWRRVDAEAQVHAWGRAMGMRTNALRIPGIYAPDRPSGTPRERLLRGTPVLRAQDDVYTNHIHADDLARACFKGLYLGAPQRNFNVCDQSQLKMGDYFDWAADHYGLPRPPRIDRASAPQQLSLMVLSFMGESRRVNSDRVQREWRLTWRYPTVKQGLAVDLPAGQ
jgi:nucleoside-diphosphate-sugar epimerase